MYQVSKLELNMLQAIDKEPWHRVEFEWRCHLRTLRRFGVRITVDDRRIVHVDWQSFETPNQDGK